MIDREKVIKGLGNVANAIVDGYICEPDQAVNTIADALALLKEQDELLKHEYWRGYKNGRADERGLQEGTIMQTFSPD